MSKFKRNEFGLAVGHNYDYKKNGTINWRSMIDPKFLYIRKDWFTRRNQEIPDSPEGLEDNQLAIMLGGIKEIAQLRGYKSCVIKPIKMEPDHVVASCKIEWAPNFENPEGCVFEDVASAHARNTDDFGMDFLETIAANRAFVRSVRNFLNIHIVGVDEFPQNKSSNEDEANASTPRNSPTATIIKLLGDLNINSFEEFKNGPLRDFWKNNSYKNEEAANWKDFSDIPTKEVRKIMALVKSLNT